MNNHLSLNRNLIDPVKIQLQTKCLSGNQPNKRDTDLIKYSTKVPPFSIISEVGRPQSLLADPGSSFQTKYHEESARVKRPSAINNQDPNIDTNVFAFSIDAN